MRVNHWIATRILPYAELNAHVGKGFLSKNVHTRSKVLYKLKSLWCWSGFETWCQHSEPESKRLFMRWYVNSPSVVHHWWKCITNRGNSVAKQHFAAEKNTLSHGIEFTVSIEASTKKKTIIIIRASLINWRAKSHGTFNILRSIVSRMYQKYNMKDNN